MNRMKEKRKGGEKAENAMPHGYPSSLGILALRAVRPRMGQVKLQLSMCPVCTFRKAMRNFKIAGLTFRARGSELSEPHRRHRGPNKGNSCAKFCKRRGASAAK